MILNKAWRILTIGDGDLSFSHSLKKYHSPLSLTATVYDHQTILQKKYGDFFYQALKSEHVQVLFEFDVTDKSTWESLEKNSFDVVIFQFPLLPAFSSFDEYKSSFSSHQKRDKNTVINTLNRQLLRTFLIHANEYFLDKNGEQLCYITSKDVKPYREWNIEQSLAMKTDLHYLGSSSFDITLFPEYKVRNVDRDKHVRDTKGQTYVWSLNKHHPIKEKLSPAIFQDENCCQICRSGPFTTNQEREAHEQSKKHQKMQEFEDAWESELGVAPLNR